MRLVKAIANHPYSKLITIAIITVVSALLSVFIIYKVGTYGIALFILLPIFIGIGSTTLYSYGKKISKGDAWEISYLSLASFLVVLIACAIEGLICIVMVAPFALGLTWIGSLIGCVLVNKSAANASLFFVLFLSIPLTALVEKDRQVDLTSVTTTIEIEASPEVVWRNVIEFPELEEPQELLFKTGIAYPINAEIEGHGVGAIRHCNFTTGSFVEPVTVWDEPRLLKFSVQEQPAPMKEIGLWDVDAPHLHDYFVSKEGQFKLTKLENGTTRLEGTTWYYHNIKPAFYWRFWSNYIIHSIHNRVLTHIKTNSEKGLK